MTPAGVAAVLASAQLIGDNVYNFYPKYAKYKALFEKTDGTTVSRDEIKAMHPPATLKVYDEVMFLKGNKDIVTTISSAMQMYDGETYDYVNAKVEDDNLVLVDRFSGDTHYLAADQINTIIRFDKDATADVIDEKTGGRENKNINEDKAREPLFYQS